MHSILTLRDTGSIIEECQEFSIFHSDSGEPQWAPEVVGFRYTKCDHSYSSK
jgi:hypothetical protein